MEDEDSNFEIEVRDGCELRYHKGQLGNYVPAALFCLDL